MKDKKLDRLLRKKASLYVLDLLDDAERREFLAQIESISQLQEHVEELRDVVGVVTEENVKIYPPPFRRLKSIARFVFPRKICERVFDEVVAQTEHEYFEALQEKAIWRARWVRILGIGTFWTAFFSQVSASIGKTIWKFMRMSG